MIRFVGQRLAAAVLLAFLVASLTFLVSRLLPGSPVANHKDPRISAGQRAELERLYGLDRPLVAQYASWVSATLQGDLGTSWSHRRPVWSVLRQHLPVTLALGGLALLVQFGVGTALGIWAASRAATDTGARPGSRVDGGIRVVSLLLYALPSFVAALLAIELFAVRLPWFPAGQLHNPGWRSWPAIVQMWDGLQHLFLPAAVLGLSTCGAVMRFTRNGLLHEFSAGYVQTARAAGLPESRIRRVHALRNAAGPLVQLLGASLPILISGSVVIEVIFSLPGLGRVAYDAVRTLDYPLTVGAVILTTTIVVLGNLVADLVHAWLDPRARTPRAPSSAASSSETA